VAGRGAGALGRAVALVQQVVDAASDQGVLGGQLVRVALGAGGGVRARGRGVLAHATSLAPHLPGDGEGNWHTGMTVCLDANGNLLMNQRPHAVMAVAGLHRMAVVATDRATLVVPLSDSQKVKALVAKVAAEQGGEFA